MERRAALDVVLAAAVTISLYPAALAAQTPNGTSKPKFDIARLQEIQGQIETFHVTQTQPLRQALESGTLKEDTRVLVTQTTAGRLALITDQMSYHHIAQGKAGGKEWMATF